MLKDFTEERIFGVIQQIHGSLCFFQMDSELPQPNIFLGSATAAKWHDARHLLCGRYERSSAQPGQLCATALALCSNILRQELELVPGFLLSQHPGSERPQFCRGWTVGQMFLGVGLFLQMTWRVFYSGTSHQPSLLALPTSNKQWLRL